MPFPLDLNLDDPHNEKNKKTKKQKNLLRSPPSPGGSSSKNNSRAGKFGSQDRRVTDTLLVANGVVFALQLLTRQRLTVMGAKINPAIRAGEWWRLLTPVLLHGNLLHLATNNFALNSLGPLTERLSGRKRFAAVYVAAGVAGSLASFAMSPAPAVGASGAIFGVGGALAVFFWRHRDYFGKASDQVLNELGRSLALNVGMGFVVANVDNWGESFFPPSIRSPRVFPPPQRIQKKTHPVFSLSLSPATFKKQKQFRPRRRPGRWRAHRPAPGPQDG
jgi:uridine nucleosidase